METNYEFKCGSCKHTWSEHDHEEQDYKEGYNCPKCKSEDISGEDLNE